jgi:hypothetical protein
MLQKETLLTTIDEKSAIKCDMCSRKVNKVWWIGCNRYCGYCINIEIINRSKEETKTCDGCGNLHDVLFKHDDRMLCRICNNAEKVFGVETKSVDAETKPTDRQPGFIVMNIASLDCGGLFDIDKGKREYYKTIEELQTCGWFLKEERNFFKGSKEFDDHGYKTIYKLLYIGKKKCKRFPSACWPISYIHCSDNMCAGQIIGC